MDELGLAAFALILPLIDGVVLLAMDDTLARKRGLKVFGVGMHREGFASPHDPLLSTRRTAIMNWGHCWVVLGVVLKPPFCAGRWFCLSVLFRLYVPKKTADKKRLSYHTKPQLAVEMLRLLCGRFKSRHFHVVADSAYGGKSVLLELPANCELTSRLTPTRPRHPLPTCWQRCVARAFERRFCRCACMAEVAETSLSA